MSIIFFIYAIYIIFIFQMQLLYDFSHFCLFSFIFLYIISVENLQTQEQIFLNLYYIQIFFIIYLSFVIRKTFLKKFPVLIANLIR